MDVEVEGCGCETFSHPKSQAWVHIALLVGGLMLQKSDDACRGGFTSASQESHHECSENHAGPAYLLVIQKAP